MRTKFHTSKKLEKLVKKWICTKQNNDCGLLGKWNATVFYVDRKKCWLVSNGLTKYNVLLPDVKSSDLINIEDIFKNSFYSQLIYDGIVIDFNQLDATVGGIDFLPTDNDKSLIAFQNQRLYELDYWKHTYATLANFPIKVLAHRLNTIPIHVGKGRKMSDYTDSVREMKKALSQQTPLSN